MLAKVELDPETDWGSLLRLEEKPPPALVESAARESGAIGPAPSLSVKLALNSRQRVLPQIQSHEFAQSFVEKASKVREHRDLTNSILGALESVTWVGC